MTISTTLAKLRYAGDGATTVFPVPFPFAENGHVRVLLRAADGTETLWSEGGDYSLSGAGDPGGGSLTASVAPANGEVLVIKRDLPATQEADLPLGGAFPSTTVETMADLAAQRDQQILEAIGRAPKFPETTALEDVSFPEAEAGKPIAWNAAGDGLENRERIGAWQGDWATATTYEALDIVRVTPGNSVYVCEVAHTSVVFATDLAANRWSLAIDVADAEANRSAAETAAANAANSASVAATSESNAASSASAAAASEIAASTSETNAASSAGTASTQASNAAASATLAEQWATQTPGAVEPGLFSAKKNADDAAAYAFAASASAGNAATSESNASSSASAASTSASNAATSETNAGNSASAAATSESNAAGSATAAAGSATDSATFALLNTTSTSSVLIGTGAKQFVTANDRAFVAGQFVKVSDQANPTVNFMWGQVTGWNAISNTLDVTVEVTGGSGTISAWNITGTGARGQQGPQGDQGVQGDQGIQGIQGPPGNNGANGAPGANGTPGANGADGINLIPRGPYSSVTTYNIGDGVARLGSFYRSLQDNNLNNPPDTSPTFWERFVSKGDPGATGPTGLAGVRTETASYTPVLADRDYLIIMNSASALNFTVPSNSSVAYPVGATLHVKQGGVGQVTIVDGAGVTVDTPATLTKRLKEQNSVVTLMKEATDTWSLIGHQETVA